MTDIPDPSAPVKRGRGRPKGSTNAAGVSKSRPKTFKARLGEYLKTLPKISPNDYSMLESLVTLEVQMEELRKKMKSVKDALEIRKLSESYTNYSKEFRQVQDALGIGRNQRSTEIDMQGEVDALVLESKELVEASGAEIACSHCTSEIQMGFVLFHFRDDVPWYFHFDCPKCGQPNTISGSVAGPLVIEGARSHA